MREDTILVKRFDIKKEEGKLYYLKNSDDGFIEIRKRKGGRVKKGEFVSELVLITDIKRKEKMMNFVKFNDDGLLELYEFPAGRSKGASGKKDRII